MSNPTIIDFEKSIAELDSNLEKLRKIVQDRSNPQNTIELPLQIQGLEQDRQTILRDIFAHLTPWDNVLLARHEKRPYTLDVIAAIFEDFEELHGDRLYGDDGAIVAGLAKFAGRNVAVVGHQKGRDIKQRQLRNFGYARPEGYRKAIRVMRMAAKFNMPIITLVDTPAASADIAADERGISAAIAWNMSEMSQLPVPIISTVIGEGGSGGALGIAVCNVALMLEHSVYSVIPPEGCAAILWRDPDKKAEAAKALNLTSRRALELGIIDEIVPEPLGGAHRDWGQTMAPLQRAITAHLDRLCKLSADELVNQRYAKFRGIGSFFDESGAGA